MSTGASNKAHTNSKPDKDPLRGHVEKFKTNKLKCKFCIHNVSGGISHFKEHVAGQKENCVPCFNALDDIRSRAKGMLETTKEAKKAKEAKLQSLQSEVSEMTTLRWRLWSKGLPQQSFLEAQSSKGHWASM